MKKLIIFMFSVVLLGSCAKEGCTDPNSINFNAEAKEDNASCLYTIVGTWEMVTWSRNGDNYGQDVSQFTTHNYSDGTTITYTLPLTWNGNNYANYRGNYTLNESHTELTSTITHYNLNDGNGWVENGQVIDTLIYNVEITNSTYSGSLLSSTDTTINSLDFSYVRVE
jgi:hypothetical protein